MTRAELIEALDGDADECLKFDRVKEPLSKRPDLHAFLLLDRLMPGTQDIIVGAAHGRVWIGVGVDELAAVITAEQVIDLARCGIFWDSSTDSLEIIL